MKLGMWSVDMDTIRRDGLILFSKLIRTKNVDNLQEQTQPRLDDRKMKLTVCTRKFFVRIWLMGEISPPPGYSRTFDWVEIFCRITVGMKSGSFSVDLNL